MKQLRKILLKWIKKIFSDSHAAIISLIVLGIIAGSGSIYLFFENLWTALIDTIQSPTPLWATTALALALIGYIYLKTKKVHSSYTPNYKTEYFTIDNLKWKVKVYNYGYFEVEKTSMCREHDLLLKHENIYYYCPEFEKKNCKIMIDHNDYSSIYETAKSYIDKEVRNNKK